MKHARPCPVGSVRALASASAMVVAVVAVLSQGLAGCNAGGIDSVPIYVGVGGTGGASRPGRGGAGGGGGGGAAGTDETGTGGAGGSGGGSTDGGDAADDPVDA